MAHKTYQFNVLITHMHISQERPQMGSSLIGIYRDFLTVKT